VTGDGILSVPPPPDAVQVADLNRRAGVARIPLAPMQQVLDGNQDLPSGTTVTRAPPATSDPLNRVDRN
jgi:hypothetical protein